MAPGVDGAATRPAPTAPSWTATVIAEVEVSIASSSTGLRLTKRAASRAAAASAPAQRGRRAPSRRPCAPASPLQRDLEVVLGQPLGQPVPPLDDRDRLVQRGVEVEVVELGDPAEPVGVDVDQGGSADQRGVHAGDDERRRGDRAADPQALRRSPGSASSCPRRGRRSGRRGRRRARTCARRCAPAPGVLGRGQRGLTTHGGGGRSAAWPPGAAAPGRSRCGVPRSCGARRSSSDRARRPRSTSDSSCWLTMSGCSSMMMWPASLTSTCSAPGISAHDLLAVRGRGQQVLLPVEHQRLDAVELLQRLALVVAVEGHHEVRA